MIAGLWITDGKRARAFEVIEWLGGKWRSSEVLLVAGSIELTLSRYQVLQKLSVGTEVSTVILAPLKERKGRGFDVEVTGRWGLLNKLGVSESKQSRWEVRRVVCASGRLQCFRARQYCTSRQSVGGRNTFWKVEFHTLEAIVVFAGDAKGSPVRDDMEFVQRDGQVNLEIEHVFSKQKKAETFVWLDRYCTRHLD